MNHQTAGAERYEVTYTLTPADVGAAFSLTRRSSYRTVTLCLFGLTTAASIFEGVRGGSWGAAIGGLVGIGVAILLLPRFTGLLVRLAPKYEGPHAVWIEPRGFGGTSAGVGDRSLLWDVVDGVYQTRKHIILQFKTGPSTIIPNRTFVSVSEQETFCQAARCWHEAATGLTTSRAS